ncbi:MAG: adenylyltransferase [Firmicutes bacterium HGW-Firmicutes-1]|jgi:adenylyltransferase/sulfurtransferase|nr:MAG: adenylyltransferase [Firmicutes bacterium HGW-Firmicutes-1]
MSTDIYNLINEKEVQRYSRQIMLKGVGIEGQKKLKNAKVLVVGTGGLGSPILYYLAAVGVGTLGIVDFDIVNRTNLQRQILHYEKDLSRYKVDSAEEKLLELNNNIKIIKHKQKIDEFNIEKIIIDYDIVVDAVDNLKSRYIINDFCHFLNKPLVEGAVSGFEGILLTILPSFKTCCYRCLFPEQEEEAVTYGSENGILGAVAGGLGSLMALEVIKLILGIGTPLTNKVFVYDGLNLKFREIEIAHKKDCILCGEAPQLKREFYY